MDTLEKNKIGGLTALRLNADSYSAIRSFSAGMVFGGLLLAVGALGVNAVLKISSDHAKDVQLAYHAQTQYMNDSNMLGSIKKKLEGDDFAIGYVEGAANNASASAKRDFWSGRAIGCNFSFGEKLRGVENVSVNINREFTALHEQAHCAESNQIFETVEYQRLLRSLEMDPLHDSPKKIKALNIIKVQLGESFADSFAYLLMVAKNPELDKTLGSRLLSYRENGVKGNKVSDHDTRYALKKSIEAWDKANAEDKIMLHNATKNPETLLEVEKKVAIVASKIAMNASQDWIKASFKLNEEQKTSARLNTEIDYSQDLTLSAVKPALTVTMSKDKLLEMRDKLKIGIPSNKGVNL